MRTARNKPPGKLPDRDKAAGEVVWDLSLRTLTPIYKGGANPDGIDEGRPFRGPAIRGLLRFWWRATHPEVHTDRLRDQEKALFGGIFEDSRGGESGEMAQVASKVRVGVLSPRSQACTKGSFCPRFGTLDYVLWVCRDDQGRVFHAPDARARLRVSCPEADRASVERALRAWVRIGGIGSRSRRGLGAFFAENAPWAQPTSAEAFVQELRDLAPTGGGRPWPTLAGARVLTGPLRGDAMAAWEEAVSGLRAVRSRDRRSATTPHPCPELTTDWRRLTAGETNFKSANAALGLPLPYQSGPGQRRQQFTLEPDRGGRGARFPSPVHLTVVPVGRRYLPAMVVLTVSHLPGFKVSQTSQRGQLDPEGLDLFCDAVGGLEGWTLHPGGR